MPRCRLPFARFYAVDVAMLLSCPRPCLRRCYCAMRSVMWKERDDRADAWRRRDTRLKTTERARRYRRECGVQRGAVTAV